MQVRINVTRRVTTPRYSGWRVLHAAEGGFNENPPGMPAVRRAINAPPVEFTRDMQFMSYDLNEGKISKGKWHIIYSSETMVTNDQSWEEMRCADYVNGIDTNLKYPDGRPILPKLMNGIICAGMFVHARSEGEYLICEPGISAVDGHKPIPHYTTVLAENKYFRAVTSGDRVFNILGSSVQILIPYILNVAVKYPLWWFERWEQDYLPDPTKFYR